MSLQCMSLYWCCSILYGVGQNLFLRHPDVRRAFCIPQTKQDTDTPYADMWTFAKEKYGGIADRAQPGWHQLSAGDLYTILKSKATGRSGRIKDSQRQTAGNISGQGKLDEKLRNSSDENSRTGRNDKGSWCLGLLGTIAISSGCHKLQYHIQWHRNIDFVQWQNNHADLLSVNLNKLCEYSWFLHILLL